MEKSSSSQFGRARILVQKSYHNSVRISSSGVTASKLSGPGFSEFLLGEGTSFVLASSFESSSYSSNFHPRLFGFTSVAMKRGISSFLDSIASKPYIIWQWNSTRRILQRMRRLDISKIVLNNLTME